MYPPEALVEAPREVSTIVTFTEGIPSPVRASFTFPRISPVGWAERWSDDPRSMKIKRKSPGKNEDFGMTNSPVAVEHMEVN
jgi:hypothetical protein